MRRYLGIFKRALHLVMVSALLLVPATVHGEAADNPVGFSVKAILPENQQNDVAYFDLTVDPSIKQTVEIEITNQLDAPLTVDIAIQDAETNPNGLITYTQPAGEKGSAGDSAPRLTSFARVRMDWLTPGDEQGIESIEGNRIVLMPRRTVRVPIELSLPDQPIAGQILGGIVVTRVEEDDAQSASAFAVRSVYSYAIALALSSGETSGIDPSVSLGSVAPSNIAGWPSLTVEIHNDAPLIITGASMRLRLYAKDAPEALIDETKERVSLAPLSTFPYALLLPDEKKLGPGEYRLVLDWTDTNGAQTLETTFAIEESIH